MFPPTDFHTATLVGNGIYVIGCLGYAAAREGAQTPVYRLDLDTMRFKWVPCAGESPGHLYRQHAEAISPTEIRVWGGKRECAPQPKSVHEDNHQAYVLDLERREWRRVSAEQEAMRVRALEKEYAQLCAERKTSADQLALAEDQVAARDSERKHLCALMADGWGNPLLGTGPNYRVVAELRAAVEDFPRIRVILQDRVSVAENRVAQFEELHG